MDEKTMFRPSLHGAIITETGENVNIKRIPCGVSAAVILLSFSAFRKRGDWSCRWSEG